MKPARVVDQMHMAPAPAKIEQTTEQGCIRPHPAPASAYEAAYAEWLESYSNQSSRTWRVWSPNPEGEPVEEGEPIEYDCAFDKTGVLRHIFNGLKHCTFSPLTEVRIHPRLASDWDALFSDWAAVGSDLYYAIRKYRISSSLVTPESTSSNSPTGAAARSEGGI